MVQDASQTKMSGISIKQCIARCFAYTTLNDGAVTKHSVIYFFFSESQQKQQQVTTSDGSGEPPTTHVKIHHG